MILRHRRNLNFLPLRERRHLNIIAHYFDTTIDNIVFTCKATDGLRLVLSRLLDSGDKVLVSPYTCITVIEAIVETGMIPAYMNIADGDFICYPEYNLDEGIKAIIATHVFGVVCDMDLYSRTAAKHNLILIEDCAQAFSSSSSRNQHVNVGTVGDFSIFSFGNGKTIDLGGGGALVINNSLFKSKLLSDVKCRNERINKVFYRIKSLADHARRTLALRAKIFFAKLLVLKPHSEVNYLAQQNPAQLEPVFNTKVLYSLLEIDLQGSISHRKAISKIYLEHIIENERIRVPQRDDISDATVMPFFPLAVRQRYELYNFLYVNGIDCGFSFSYYCDENRNVHHQCTESLSDLILNIPVHEDVSSDSAHQIVSLINQWSGAAKIGAECELHT